MNWEDKCINADVLSVQCWSQERTAVALFPCVDNRIYSRGTLLPAKK